jgi:hypothetical protein
MAKVTKTMLKGIVKECLVEILSEGLGDTETMVESVKRAPKRRVQKSRSIFDQMDEAFEKKSQPSGNSAFDSRVDQVASVATSDPVLQSILADTARTTLQEQMKHEPRMPSRTPMPMQQGMPSPSVGPEVSGAAAGLDINSLFGEATRNWGEVLERTERKLP